LLGSLYSADNRPATRVKGNGSNYHVVTIVLEEVSKLDDGDGTCSCNSVFWFDMFHILGILCQYVRWEKLKKSL